MDLIVWRPPETDDEDGDVPDADRQLTRRGRKHAEAMAAWLGKHLPAGVRVVSSPAHHAEQTVRTLGRSYKLRAELAPGGTPEDVLDLVRWPARAGAVLVVGHQPMLGSTIAQLLGLHKDECAIRKGSVWWLRHRVRAHPGGIHAQTVVVTVQTAESIA